jgi:hypothetical protein
MSGLVRPTKLELPAPHQTTHSPTIPTHMIEACHDAYASQRRYELLSTEAVRQVTGNRPAKLLAALIDPAGQESGADERHLAA